MKVLKNLLLLSGLALFTLSSCGGAGSANVDVSKLDKPCDFVEAMVTVTKSAEAANKLEGEAKNKTIDELKGKMAEMAKAMAGKEITKEALSACDGFAEKQAAMQKALGLAG